MASINLAAVSSAATSVLTNIAARLPFLQLGTGAVSRTMDAELRDLSVSAKRFGAKGDGTTNDSAALQAALDWATANNYAEVSLPPGVFILASTVTMNRCKLRGSGPGSILRPTITNGTPAIDVVAGANYFSLEDLVVDNGLDQTAFLAGSVSGQACTGIRVRATGSTYAARFHFKNVKVRGCAIGYDIQGFIASMENLWAQCCDVALVGVGMNSVRLNVRWENNRKDVTLTNSSGVHWDQYLSEGGDHPSSVASSTFDNCHGMFFSALYLEQNRNVPFMTFGATTECRNLNFPGGNVALKSTTGVGNNYDKFPLAFDRVNGLQISCQFSTGSHHNYYSTTANTKNIVDLSAGTDANFWGPHDASTNLGRVLNYFPNPHFDLWLRGWSSIAVTRCVISQETTIVRRGQNAVKVLMNAAQTNCSVGFVLSEGIVAAALRGKTVTLYMSVWVPNTADFNPDDLGAQLALVSLKLSSTNATPTTTTAQSGNHHTVRGAWNLMAVTHTIQSDATSITCTLDMSKATGSSGAEMLVVDHVYLVEGSGQRSSVVNGYVIDSEMNPCKNYGGKLRQLVAALPTDADLVFAVGDRLEYLTPASGASWGVQVTTAATGSTLAANSKSMGNLA